MWLIRAFLGRGWERNFLTQFEHAESNYPGSQAKFWVFDHLICINMMAANFSFLRTVFVKTSRAYNSWFISHRYLKFSTYISNTTRNSTYHKKVKGQGRLSFWSSDTKCTAADHKLRPRQIHACAVMIFSSRLKMKFAWHVMSKQEYFCHFLW